MPRAAALHAAASVSFLEGACGRFSGRYYATKFANILAKCSSTDTLPILSIYYTILYNITLYFTIVIHYSLKRPQSVNVLFTFFQTLLFLFTFRGQFGLWLHVPCRGHRVARKNDRKWLHWITCPTLFCLASAFALCIVASPPPPRCVPFFVLVSACIVASPPPVSSFCFSYSRGYNM